MLFSLHVTHILSEWNVIKLLTLTCRSITSPSCWDSHSNCGSSSNSPSIETPWSPTDQTDTLLFCKHTVNDDYTQRSMNERCVVVRDSSPASLSQDPVANTSGCCNKAGEIGRHRVLLIFCEMYLAIGSIVSHCCRDVLLFSIVCFTCSAVSRQLRLPCSLRTVASKNQTRFCLIESSRCYVHIYLYNISHSTYRFKAASQNNEWNTFLKSFKR